MKWQSRKSLLSEAIETDKRLRGSPHDDAGYLRDKLAAARSRLFWRSLALAAVAAVLLSVLFWLMGRT
jgi:hypothetical protein